MTFVVYKHIRLDTNEVFYIGIGKLSRAYQKGSRNIHWTRIVELAGYRVEIIHEGLTWEEACEYEVKYIKEFGRRDLGTGPLVNMTDGADGKVGYKFSEESKKKIGESNKGKLVGEKNPFFGKKHPPELIAQIEETKKKNPWIPTPEQKEKWASQMRGRKIHDDDSKKRIVENMPHRRPIDVWKQTGEYVGRFISCSNFVTNVLGFQMRTDTHKQYKGAMTRISSIINGREKRKHYKGYGFKAVTLQQEMLPVQ